MRLRAGKYVQPAGPLLAMRAPKRPVAQNTEPAGRFGHTAAGPSGHSRGELRVTLRFQSSRRRLPGSIGGQVLVDFPTVYFGSIEFPLDMLGLIEPLYEMFPQGLADQSVAPHFP